MRRRLRRPLAVLLLLTAATTTAATAAAAQADCQDEALRSVAALRAAGLLEAANVEAAQRVLTQRCTVADEQARTAEVLGVKLRRAEPDSAGNRRLEKRR